MRWNVALLMILLSLAVQGAERLLWNNGNAFGAWKAAYSIDVKRVDDVLKLKMTGHDPRMVVGNLAINPKDYKAFEFRYRVVSGVSKQNSGDFFFLPKESENFTAKNNAKITGLEIDGEWHIKTVSLGKNEAWNNSTIVKALRYDPVITAPGEIELDYLALIPYIETTSGPLEDEEDGRFIAFEGDYKVSTENPFSGQRCMEQGERADGEDLARSVKAFPAKPGTLYQIAVQARNTVGSGDVIFGIGQSRTASAPKITRSSDWKWNKLTCNASQWRVATVRVRTSKDTNGIVVFFKTTSHGVGRAWWDKLTIMELAEEMPPFSVEPFAGEVSFIGLPLLHAEHTYLKGIIQSNSKWISEQIDRQFLTAHCNETGLGYKFKMQLTGGKGIVAEEEQETARENRFQVPIDSLPVGQYVLGLSLVAPDGTIKHQIEQMIYRFEPFNEKALPPIETVKVTKDRILVNGSTFRQVSLSAFPIVHRETFLNEIKGIDEYTQNAKRIFGLNLVGIRLYLPDRPRPAALGEKYLSSAIDFYANAYLRDLDWCQAHHVYGVASLHLGETLRPYGKPEPELIKGVASRINRHPALLFWNYDEPECHKLTPEEVADMVKAAKDGDPYHPVVVNLCQPWNFHKFIGLSDIASYDYYPFPNSSLAERRTFTETMRSVAGDKLLMNYQQAYQNPVIDEIPPLDFFKASFAMDTIDDSRDLIFFSWGVPDEHCMLTDIPMQWHAAIVTHIAAKLTPFVDEAVRETLPIESQGDVISSCWKKGTEQCLVIANINGEKKATVKLPKAAAITNFIDETWCYQPESTLSLKPLETLFLMMKKDRD